MQFEQLGPYRLGKKLGQGGMGAVYEGVDAETGEAAAIKVLAPGLATEEGFRGRFEAEIESLKKLRHPNIVRLYGYGEQSGTLFYAMEKVDGTSLEDELRAGRRFEWREVTQIAVKLCRALKHAHDHGVIHRDLKPANLLLTAEGEIKLSDFGIARLFGNTRMTSDGGLLGTAEYMAPEQVEGRTVTDRCDQYSLGGVMYALLTGRPPFRAKTFVEMLQLQRYAEPELVTRFAPQTPAELARIIHQLLDKDPQKRFANTLMLARSLEAMERGLSVSLSRGDDFVVTPPESFPLANSGYGAQAPTLSPTQLRNMQQPPADESLIGETAATMAYVPGAMQQASAVEPTESPPPVTATDRFTKVQERRDQDGGGWGEAVSVLLAPQTLALVCGLLLLVLAGWYLSRSPSADDLYHRIETATADGDPDSFDAAQPNIKAFLSSYPDDPRAETLRDMQEDTKQSHPVKRLYTEAKRYTAINPELALAKFTALIDVYDDDQASEATRVWIKKARVQQKQLQTRIQQYVADGQSLLESRLAKAAEIAPSDPAAARKIYQGIVALYDEKPWAAEFVEQAKTALAKALEPQAAAR